MKITRKNLEKLIEQELDRNDQKSIDIKVDVDGVEAKRGANIITVRYNGKVSRGRIQSYASTVNYEDLTDPNDSNKKNYDKAIQSALRNVGAPTKGAKEGKKESKDKLQEMIKEEIDKLLLEEPTMGPDSVGDLTMGARLGRALGRGIEAYADARGYGGDDAPSLENHEERLKVIEKILKIR